MLGTQVYIASPDNSQSGASLVNETSLMDLLRWTIFHFSLILV